MNRTIDMVAKRDFPRLADNGDGVQRVSAGASFKATANEARHLEDTGKAERVEREPAAPAKAKKEG